MRESDQKETLQNTKRNISYVTWCFILRLRIEDAESLEQSTLLKRSIGGEYVAVAFGLREDPMCA